MTISTRERFLGICRFERPGDLYIREMWGHEALMEWVKQGASEQILDWRGAFVENYFQCFNWFRNPVFVGRRMHTDISSSFDFGTAEEVTPVYPPVERRVISEDDRTLTTVNGTGQMVKQFKDETFKMPMYLDWPVKDRATWKEYKKRLDPNTPGRFRDDWNDYVQKMNKLGEEQPIQLHVGSFFGYLREWVGMENLLYMFHDDPSLIEDMMDTVLYLETEIIKRTLKDIRIDMGSFWEDMAYKAGPLISPAMVRKFMMPRYKKITDLLHSYGVDVIFIDSDGNCEQLIPLWLEVGINYIWPYEVAAGNDAVADRKKYGRDLIIGGGIDKRALIKGKEAIRVEIMSKVPFLLEQGGYFPSVDHYIPPGITFENYCYYINTLREVAGLKKLPFP